ncbi:MAG: DNA polymerase III subunit alpha [Promethearchaeota archaeon]
MKDFTHLHLHTEYSILDGLGRITDIVNHAKNMGFKSLAITDHGSICGTLQFYLDCKEVGIKPILGCEMNIVDNINEKKRSRNHIILLAKNEIGFKNLLKLTSKSYIDGFYYVPRIDFNLLKENSEGLIVMTSCIKGEIPTACINNDQEKAIKLLKLYKDVFDDDFYLELQFNELEDQKKANACLKDFSKRFGIKCILTNDIHYLLHEDNETHDILLLMQTKKTVTDKNVFRFTVREAYMKNYAEMLQSKNKFGFDNLFSDSDVEKYLDNTNEIRDKINFDIETGKTIFPYFDTGNLSDIEFLMQECKKRFKFLCEKERFTNDKIRKYLKRLKYELSVIEKLKFASYFLILYDMVNFAKNNGILKGAGRGSAAGSLVSYILGITDLDPIKFDLYFERFLNLYKASIPDIDLDFDAEKRDLIKEYLAEKYGKNNVASIGAFSTFGSKGVVKDVARVFNIDHNIVDRLTVYIDNNKPLNESIERNDKLKEFFSKYPQVRKHALRLEGQVKNITKHAAGLIITKDELWNYVPLIRSGNSIVVGWTQGKKRQDLEYLGLLKIDILALQTLTIIRDAINFIKENQNKIVDIQNIDLNIKEIYEKFSRGLTFGIFQLESSQMRQLIMQVKPTAFEHLVAVIALFRPGPIKSGVLNDYIDRKNGRKNIDFEHSILKDILNETYGIPLFQEQVMAIYSHLAGFDMAEADKFRKDILKDLKKEEIENYRQKFVNGCKRINNINEEKANKIWNLMQGFVGYGFNKSHAVSYAFLSYQTMYLKHYYKAEFYAALLSSTPNTISKVKETENKFYNYLGAARKDGIEILKPDINKSKVHFTVEGNAIRFSLSAIRNIGIKAASKIVQLQPFESFDDFMLKIKKQRINKKIILNLLYMGCFDCFEDKIKIFEKFKKYNKNVKDEEFYSLNEENVLGFKFFNHLLYKCSNLFKKNVLPFISEIFNILPNQTKNFIVYVEKFIWISKRDKIGFIILDDGFEKIGLKIFLKEVKTLKDEDIENIIGKIAIVQIKCLKKEFIDQDSGNINYRIVQRISALKVIQLDKLKDIIKKIFLKR